MQNKTLLVFPILSFVCTLVILSFVVTPLAFQRTGYKFSQLQHWKAVSQTLVVEKPTAPEEEGVIRRSRSRSSDLALKPMAIAVGAVIYLISMFLATFFNVAFFHQILQALRGNPISVVAGLQFAVSKLKAILLWSLFAGVIGLVIKTLEERLDFIGRIILRFVGVAWSVASVFVIPVLIVESEVNPVSILRKSASTLKKTWGESLAGYLGLQFGGVLVLMLSLVFLGGALVGSIMLNSFWIMAIAGVFWVFGLIAFAYISSVASQVYRCALFVYASEGTIPQPFNSELLQMAWKMKKA
jgi:hypothetical protein